ncbi:DNA-directed RNA polymerase subunit alpha [Candidatus Riflebacteria bacterium]
MSIEIQRPKLKFKMAEADDGGIIGQFTLEPLERGYGVTIGNALRRVLLSSLPGAVVTVVQMDNVLHEFTAVEGIMESVMEMLLNLKKVIFKPTHTLEKECFRVEVQGPCVITAEDIQKTSPLEVVNKDLYIATLTKDFTFGLDLTVVKGRGYQYSENFKSEELPLNAMVLDANFSPVRRVNYKIEATRVGDDLNYDRLNFEVETNGAIRPDDAIKLASKFLYTHLQLFDDLKVEESVLKEDDIVMVSKQKEEGEETTQVSIKDLEFSVRSRNCLKKAGIIYLNELTRYKPGDLLEIKNFGKKSLKEITEKMKLYNLSLASDVDE